MLRSFPLGLLIFLLFLSGCQPEVELAALQTSGVGQPPPVEATSASALPTANISFYTPERPTPQSTSTTTPVLPTVTAAQPITETPLPVTQNQSPITQTPTPIVFPTPENGCSDQMPSADDLLVIVTKSYGMSRGFIPPDLVPLSDYFPVEITLGYPTLIRGIIAAPLQQMISDMQAAGLQPQIISGYRDYHTQALAYQKWAAKFPDRADQLSAPPGHSEHQLGTTVDFGSPNLADYIEEEELKNQQFHTHFYMTPEGQWLLENAHLYGFTLSYPREAIELTGFFYEPWHYRYVGIETATMLKETGLTLTEFQLINSPDPCQ